MCPARLAVLVPLVIAVFPRLRTWPFRRPTVVVLKFFPMLLVIGMVMLAAPFLARIRFGFRRVIPWVNLIEI